MGRARKAPNVVFIERERTEVPFNDAAQAYRRSKLIERKLTRGLERCIALWNNAFAGLMCSDINQNIIDAHVSKHMSHLKPNSIARYMLILKAMLNDAHGRGMLDAVPKVKLPTFFDERDEHLTHKEVGLLLQWAVAELHPIQAMALATLIYTGVRVNELCALRGRDFGDSALTVVKKSGKTRNTRSVPYAKTYRDIFKPEGMAATYGDGFPFKEVGRTPEAMSHQMGNILRAGLAAIGVTRGVRVHDLRHTFAFLCGSAGMDLGDLQLLMGHANLSMTIRYRGFIQSRALDVMARM